MDGLPRDLGTLTFSEAKEIINDWLYLHTKGIVQTGPFAGMKVPREEVWKDGSLGTKLLGCYEQELHGFIEQEIARLAVLPSPKIVNIGCAEGFYAVGLARRLPAATVYAVDINEAMAAAAAAAADMNAVSLRIGCSIDEVYTAPDLLVVDCEGAEVEYLDQVRFPSLAWASIIVECHDFDHQHTSKILAERFFLSHDIFVVVEGARNPNIFECLQQWHSMARWAAVSEGRPCMMNWFLMRPKVEA